MQGIFGAAFKMKGANERENAVSRRNIFKLICRSSYFLHFCLNPLRNLGLDFRLKTE